MPAIVVLVLAAVFAAGNALANAPDAPVRERAEAQAIVIVVPNAEKVRPPEVAAKTGHRPLPDSHYRWPDSSDGLRKPQHQEWQGRERLRLEERLGEWKRERALACLRGVLPDADESELESALEDAANCIKCPQVCKHLSDEFWRPNLNATPRLNAPPPNSGLLEENPLPHAIPESIRLPAKQGNAEAQYQAGQLFYYGQRVTLDYKRAEKWFRRAAEQGHLEAQNSYAFIYSEGRGFPKDPAKAAEWFRRAAERGFAKSQSNLGVLYREGEGIPQDHREAAKWFHRAAEQGYRTAQYFLGLSYLKGQGVAQNYAEAAKWSWLASEQGYASAQFILGLMYYEGHGVLKNRTQAAEWFRRAAEQGNMDAGRKLAELFRTGAWVPKDLEKAERLMELVRCSAENEKAAGQVKSAGDDDAC